jgi:hypothetical protein
MADYFTAQATPGHVALYYLATMFTDAVTFSKILPLVLTLVQTGFAYRLGVRLWRQPALAALGAVLLAWLSWWFDDLASASPRSFGTPLLVIHLACLAHRQWRAAAGTVALQALCYPVVCGVMLATHGISLLLRTRGRLSAGKHGVEMRWLGIAGVLAVSLVWLGRLPSAVYGPIISIDAARRMSEFQGDGRVSYFDPDLISFWLVGQKSGIGLWRTIPGLGELPLWTLPGLLIAALALWMVADQGGTPRRSGAPSQSGLLLAALLVGSLVLFVLSHAVAFRLYLPSRQLQFSLPVILALTPALLMARILERRPATAARSAKRSTQLALVGSAMLVVWETPIADSYVEGRHRQLYAYVQSMPKDTRIIARPEDGSSLPLFGQRAVLVSQEHALPFHPSYYEPLRRRAEAVLAAYRAESPRPMLALAEREGASLILENLATLERTRQRRSEQTGVELLVERCAVLRDEELVAISVGCAQASGIGAGNDISEAGRVLPERNQDRAGPFSDVRGEKTAKGLDEPAGGQ